MCVRETITIILVVVTLAGGTASQNLANALGRADFSTARKADDRRCCQAA